MRVSCGVCLIFAAILGQGTSETRSCSYATLCERQITINRPCFLLPRCRDVIVNVPCQKTEQCESNFEPWTSCSATCGIGTRTRFGRCCGPSCTRQVSETEACDSGISCNVDGNWASWQSWTETACSASCCGGTLDRTRTRTCTDPAPVDDGAFCDGPMTETESNVPCNEQDCPIVGNECDGSSETLAGTCGNCASQTYILCEDGTLGNNTVETLVECGEGELFSTTINACLVASICF